MHPFVLGDEKIMEKEQLVSLVTAGQNGDNDALNTLFNAFYNDLYYFALKTVNDDDLALEITQEAFVEIISTLTNLKEPAAFVTWAKQITYHQCTRYFKKKKDLLVDEDEDGHTIFDDLQEENSEFIPHEALDKNDFKNTILAILNNLSEEQRSAAMMFYFDEMSVKDIAQIQGVSEGTIKSRLNYARKAIKAEVEEYEKKNGIKLHAFGMLGLFRYIFGGSFEGGLAVPAAQTVASGVTAATGATVTVTVTSAGAATSAAIGIGAKIAALPLVTKIVAGVVAASIAIGGTTIAAVKMSDKSQEAGTQNTLSSQITSTELEEITQNYDYYLSYMDNWDSNTVFNNYFTWITNFDMPYFDSADHISIDDAARFTFGYWAGKDPDGNLQTVGSVAENEALLSVIFKRKFDLSTLKGKKAEYLADTKEFKVKTDKIDSANLYYSFDTEDTKNKDGSISRKISIYRKTVSSLPDGIKDGEYTQGEDGKYYISPDEAILTIKKQDGYWTILSYTKQENSSQNQAASSIVKNTSSTKQETELEYLERTMKRYAEGFSRVANLTFKDADEISADDMATFLMCASYTENVSATVNQIFGPNFKMEKMNELTDSHHILYDPDKDALVINTGFGDSDTYVYSSATKTADKTYKVTFNYFDYDLDANSPGQGQKGVSYEEIDGQKYTITKMATLYVSLVDGYWRINELTQSKNYEEYQMFDLEDLTTISLYKDGRVRFVKAGYETYTRNSVEFPSGENYDHIKELSHMGHFSQYGIATGTPNGIICKDSKLRYVDSNGQEYITFDAARGSGGNGVYSLNSNGTVYSVNWLETSAGFDKIYKDGSTLYVEKNSKKYRLLPYSEEFTPVGDSKWIIE